jgi:hypothetical protein
MPRTDAAVRSHSPNTKQERAETLARRGAVTQKPERRDLQYLSSPGGHIGEEKWHELMDDAMLAFIRRKGKRLTENELLSHIHQYYQNPDIAARIPGVNLGF